jgi:hypothetical protein
VELGTDDEDLADVPSSPGLMDGYEEGNSFRDQMGSPKLMGTSTRVGGEGAEKEGVGGSCSSDECRPAMGDLVAAAREGPEGQGIAFGGSGNGEGCQEHETCVGSSNAGEAVPGEWGSGEDKIRHGVQVGAHQQAAEAAVGVKGEVLGTIMGWKALPGAAAANETSLEGADSRGSATTSVVASGAEGVVPVTIIDGKHTDPAACHMAPAAEASSYGEDATGSRANRGDSKKGQRRSEKQGSTGMEAPAAAAGSDPAVPPEELSMQELLSVAVDALDTKQGVDER